MSEVNSQGAAQSDIAPGQTGKGPEAPLDTGLGRKPVEPSAEEEVHGVPLKKGPSDKAKEVEAGKPDPKQDDEPGDDDDTGGDDESWKGQYISLPHEAGQSVIDLLKESGVSPVEANAIFAKAAETENLNDIQWDVLESRLGSAKFKLAKLGIETYYKEQFVKGAETVRAVHEEIGGEKNWNTVKKWAQAKEGKDPAFKKELDEIRAGIEAGGRSARYAAKDLKALYEADKGNKGLATDKIIRGDNRPAQSGAPLSRKEYMVEMHKANEAGKPQSHYAELRARRAEGRAQGI